MTTEHFKIEIFDRIEAIQSAWKQLDASASALIQSGELRYINYSFYQTYEWNEFLSHTYRYSLGHPQFVVVTCEGETKIILPLLVEKLKKRARFLSGRIAGILNAACPYTDPTAHEAMTALVQFLKDHYKGWKIRLLDMPRHSLLAETLIQQGASFSERASFHVPLSDFASYDDYIASLGKNIYKNIRKAYNHLTTDNKTFQLDVYDKHHLPSNQLLTKVWTLYFRRKLAWKHKRQSFLSEVMCRLRAWRQDTKVRQTKSMKLLQESQLYTLTIDGQLAAFMHVYLHEGHALMPKLAIDASYSRYSPGILLVLETLKQMMPQGVKDFDMCRGDERYKREVGGQMEPLASVPHL